MYKDLPPIQLLIAFEAAAQLHSFKLAAQALCITPSAVSQQIKQLEQHLNMSLFNRLTRRVELNEYGKAYLRVAEQTLSTYRNCHDSFLYQVSNPILRISMIPFVAYEIVIPALHEFKSLHPNIELRIETSMSLIDFDREPVDAAIRLGDGNWPGLETHSISPCHCALVASPHYITNNPIDTIRNLSGHTLIHMQGSMNDWQRTSEFLKGNTIEHNTKLVMDSYIAAMRAAEQGLGIAIGQLPLLATWLKAGRLVTLNQPVMIPEQYYFVLRKTSVKKEVLLDFYHWLTTKFNAEFNSTDINSHTNFA